MSHGFDSIAQCIIALQDGDLATIATEMALSAQTLYSLEVILACHMSEN